MKSYIKLLRVYQYVKNLFIFAPLFFAGEIFNFIELSNVFIVFLYFSLLASSVYIFNDIMDIEDDKKHEVKRKRPLASGKIKKKEGYFIAAILSSFSLLGIFFISVNVFYIAILYVVMNIIYSLYLKHIAPYDIILISIGFVLRLYIGSFTSNIALSSWIIIVTFFLALFLSTTKRFAEVEKKDKNVKIMRKSIDGYSHQFVNIALAVTTSMSLFSYVMFVTTKNIPYLFLSTIFVLLGFFRFLQLTIIESKTEDTTLSIVKDKQMIIIVLLWAIFYSWIIYV